MRHLTLALALVGLPARADEATDALARELRSYAAAELAEVPRKDERYSSALGDYLKAGIYAANIRDREAWGRVRTRAEWEAFRDERIAALRRSLGTFPEVPRPVPGRVTRTITAGDYAIDNLLYESRPGVWVTGNLYRPAAARERMPVIVLVHSHHAPKEQGELQDMGVTWAKLGCLVLVIDQLGHGERRQHPFATAQDYPKEFRVGRQDYYFRYNLSLQLSLVGDSLTGWMAWDLMRGLDVALARPGADRDRVILLGAVAGGGDVAAVTAALDPRITCVVPFNFGGPQPETRYPLPENAEEWFNYAGSGSWESTRNLRDSAAGGFLPWVVVASVAPRRVIHAHEFSWDRARDPVWKRYQKVWGFYDATDHLGFTNGTGQIQINDDKASHCTNIGPVHRKGIYAALKKWFDIPVPEAEAEANERRLASELRCWTEEALKELKPKPLHEVLAGVADEQLERMRLGEGVIPAHSRTHLLLDRLRVPFPYHNDRADFGGFTRKTPIQVSNGCEATWASFDVEPGTSFRGLVIRPTGKANEQLRPGVICVCQDGAHRFLRQHANAVATLIRSGMAVILPEVSGPGLRQSSGDRGRTSPATSLSATAQMLGQSLLGTRFDDLITLWKASVRDVGVDDERVMLWGESLAAPNVELRSIAVPYDLNPPHSAECLGPTLVSLLALGKADVKAVVARGGLVSFRSVLDSPFVHVPHDALPANVFRAGDLPDVWAHLAPKALRLEGLVDGINRRVTGERLERELWAVRAAYGKDNLIVKEDYAPDAELARWIVDQLRK